ncbi:MAG: hypothetical protein ABIR30_13150 [Chitinophagaceae bacterium]
MKEIIGLLGIVLPALIIILGIIRIFVEKTKGVNGLTMLFAILLLLVGLVRYFIFPSGSNNGSEDSKMTPLIVSSHSDPFNKSVEKILNSYSRMNEGFAGGDTVLVNRHARYLQLALDSFRIGELKTDSLIYETALQPFNNAKLGVATILLVPSLEQKRSSLNTFSNELQVLVSIIRFDRVKLYWLECPDAFGEDKPGNWLSTAEKSANPYGKEDCAEIKTTINFVPVDTTIKQ